MKPTASGFKFRTPTLNRRAVAAEVVLDVTASRKLRQLTKGPPNQRAFFFIQKGDTEPRGYQRLPVSPHLFARQALLSAFMERGEAFFSSSVSSNSGGTTPLLPSRANAESQKRAGGDHLLAGERVLGVHRHATSIEVKRSQHSRAQRHDPPHADREREVQIVHRGCDDRLPFNGAAPR